MNKLIESLITNFLLPLSFIIVITYCVFTILISVKKQLNIKNKIENTAPILPIVTIDKNNIASIYIGDKTVNCKILDEKKV